MSEPKPFHEQVDVIAVTGEVLIIIGCTLLIFLHYFGSAEGLSVISAAGILLSDFVACAGLHFALKRHTPMLKGAGFAIWLGLTMLTAVLAGAVWLHIQHTTGNATIGKEIAKLTAQLDSAKRRETRQELQRQIAGLREQAAVPAFAESSTWHWIYSTGVQTLPFPCGIVGLALLLALSAWKAKAERAAVAPQQSPAPPAFRPVGFNPQPVHAKSDPKDSGQWI